MLRRWWNYIKTWFGMKSKEVMDPKVEIEAAIADARKRDQALRNEAAKVIAHRTRVADEMQDAASDVAESKELARQALVKADAAATGGSPADSEKWNQAAQAVAMKMQASQKNLDSLTQQLQIANQQADQAKTAVQDNAMRLQEITAKRMEMLGQLEQANMQESVNSAMASINATVGGDAPSLNEIEDKIKDRMAQATAKTELHAATPEGAMAELAREVNLQGATTALDDLRKELGMAPPPQVGAGDTPAGAIPSETSAPAPPPPPPPSTPSTQSSPGGSSTVPSNRNGITGDQAPSPN